MKNCLFAFLISISFGYSQSPDPVYSQKQWPAKWISVPKTSETKYGVYLFRKTLELPSKPASFPIYISADNRYKLYVNGLLVGTGPAKGDLFNWNYDQIDLAAYLISGKNTIAVKVWNEAELRPEFQIIYQTGLIVQGVTKETQEINSDRNWLCMEDKSYEPVLVKATYSSKLPNESSDGLVKGYYVAGPGEKVDMNKHVKGWANANFDDSKWTKAQQGSPGIPKNTVGLDGGNSWRLVPSIIPQMELKKQRFHQMVKAEGLANANDISKGGSLQISANTKVSLIFDHAELTNAYPTLVFSSGKDAKIIVTYAESLYGEKGKGNRNEIEGKRLIGRKDILISDGSDFQEFSPLAYRTFRYISVDIETKETALKINDLYSTFTGYPFELKSNLMGESAEMTQMLDIGWRTAQLCANETYMDCPYYEQLQYIGDTRIQAMVTLYNTGDDRLVENALNLMDISRKPEGITTSRYPSMNSQIIPTFSLWYIGMLNDYMMYGSNADFIKSKLGGTRQILDYFESFRDVDGSVKNLPNWFYVDWASKWTRGMPPIGKNGNSAVLDLQLTLAYQYAANLEKNKGLNELSQIYLSQSEALKKMILDRYWDTEKGLFADTPEKNFFSQHANAMAILAGVATGEEAKLLGEKLRTDPSLTQASIYFKYYVHQALIEAGFGNEYLSFLNIWRDHINMGLTTWGEDTDANTTRSDCHAWGASPNIEFYRTILGIDSDGLGFSKILITPHLGDLTSISGKIPHPNGEVSTSYKLEKKKWQVAIEIPKNTEAKLIWKGKTMALKTGMNSLSLP